MNVFLILSMALVIITLPFSSSFPIVTHATHPVLATRTHLTPSFDCPDLDHHFIHQRLWIAASSTSGCMTLEQDLDIIHELNRIASPRPAGFKTGETLLCSLESGMCAWGYSPLEMVRDEVGEIT
jgi:hypothetical protein